MVVLLTGASGFIGRHIARSLRAAGHHVVAAVRPGSAVAGAGQVEIDFNRDVEPGIWTPRLAGVDVVINAVGLFRQGRPGDFARVHAAAPAALFEACARAGVAHVIQISALGADARAASTFHRSKREADERLRALPVASSILQPSLVFGPDGASARQLLALASLPLIPLPSLRPSRVQPVHVEDLAELVCRRVAQVARERSASSASETFAVVGPEALTLREYLGVLRAALGIGAPARFVAIPRALVRAGARVLGLGEGVDMLERGNTADAAPFAHALGRPPRAPRDFVAPEAAPLLAQRARLDWLLPLLRASLAVLWIVTGLLSLGLYPREESYALLRAVHLPEAMLSPTLTFAALLDLALGLGLLVRRLRGVVWLLQIATMLGYTLIITIALPAWWLHPFAPVLKNLPLLAATLLLQQLESRR